MSAWTGEKEQPPLGFNIYQPFWNMERPWSPVSLARKERIREKKTLMSNRAYKDHVIRLHDEITS